MANKGVVNSGYQYATGNIQKREQTDAYTFNKGEKLETIFNNLLDVDSSAEYLELSSTGVITGYILKEEYLKDSDRVIAGVPIVITAANKLNYFVISRTVSTGAGGPELDPVYTSEKGQPLGVPTLDASGKILPTFLPAAVAATDDVLEFATQSAFPAVGTIGKVYIDLAADAAFVWDTVTNAYKPLAGVTTGDTISNFSATTAYTAGQLVIESGKIYQANAATPAGVFNAAQWTEISPAANAITTQNVTLTGILTPAQETVMVAGFNKNVTTGEVWFKDAAGVVTKLEDINLNLTGGGPTTNTLSYDTANSTLTSTVNSTAASVVIPAGFSQDITLQYAEQTASAGLSFNTASNGGIQMVQLPTGVTSAQIDVPTFKAAIYNGTSPASSVLVEVKRGVTLLASFTVPANATSATVLTPTVVPNIALSDGDLITVNLSAAMPLLDFGMFFVIK